ncbi:MULTISPECIES: Fe-S cluster assembly sulfur transfer protein SufU [Salimicrobium]|uniref:NifU family iron-sulfur cluster assembly protein n=4 Tax=Salimicrobium TaxID=351195 RepID=K2GDF9_9BACI|nr:MULTISPECIES: SUF system NifU family Fe-S cluster assembly protein [Salimicrobium]AKG03981.1 SUF system NifU family Fe-S cluster assembly protein [Salimicrobium jeotgali]EKE33018.1 NifU family iron-sulfur cluster assembly protein [Salimicrobium jeotgali]MBM7694988.1 nitrogen fixation NifU-like protein [Salimicrobium jeotgali]PBB06273.1 SUF system NifU family Fe-S cluster assembly protein [Salimicrobium humidisoli]SDY00633.1 nitrogen fixation protein NifU [Salimicrobium album]
MSFNNLDTLYRQVIMDHYKNPRNKGSIEGEHMAIDMNNPTCGDRIQLQLQLEDGVVNEAKFDGEGCSISLSSASMMTEAVKGKTVEEALEMSKLFSAMMQGEDVDPEQFALEDIEALQGVSQFPARIKCATLSWKAMEQGVEESEEA